MLLSVSATVSSIPDTRSLSGCRSSMFLVQSLKSPDHSELVTRLEKSLSALPQVPVLENGENMQNLLREP